MRLRRRIFAEISEYLQQHYTGAMPLFGEDTPRRLARQAKKFEPRGASFEDSSVLMGEDELLVSDEIEPLPCSALEPSRPAPRPYNAAAPAPSQREPKPCNIAPAPSQREPKPCNIAPAPQYAVPPTAAFGDLSERLNTLDESFQEALLRLIDERGMKDSACYKRAGVDRKLFSKIRSNPSYRPSKPTVIAFVIALELNLDETVDLLRKAGYALSHSSKFDVIVEYFIVKRRFSLRELNEALYEFDQPLVNG